MGCGKSSSVAPTGNYYLKDNVVALINQAFDEIDTDKSGQLSLYEAAPGLYKCGFDANAEAVEKLIKLVDDDNTGQLNKDEFVRCCICLTLAESDKENYIPYMFFVAADRDLSGKVTKKEFEKIVKKMQLEEKHGKDKVKAAMKTIKSDLTKDQYIALLKQIRAK